MPDGWGRRREPSVRPDDMVHRDRRSGFAHASHDWDPGDGAGNGKRHGRGDGIRDRAGRWDTVGRDGGSRNRFLRWTERIVDELDRLEVPLVVPAGGGQRCAGSRIS